MTSRRLFLFIALVLSLLVAAPARPRLQDAGTADRFTIRDVMIPTRDGVRLHTKIFTPRRRAGHCRSS